MKNSTKNTGKAFADPSEDEWLFVPLGGCGEIGMNLNLYGHAGSWVMVDCGVIFPGAELPGVDIATPDADFAFSLGDKLAGVVLTHAHEDHLGAVPYLAEWLHCPIYTTRFTAAFLRRKLQDNNAPMVDLREVEEGARLTIGATEVEWVGLTHSIPEPNALALRTSLGTVFHTGDWKLDESPGLGHGYDEKRLQAIGAESPLAMVCDSTNALIAGVSGSEQKAAEGLIEEIALARGKVFVACFASNVARLNAVVQAATKAGRRVALLGRSMERVVGAARAAGYLEGWPKLESPNALRNAPPEKVLYLCTGSQGDTRAALKRLSENRHPQARVEEGDTVIFSSRIIPGNERSVFDLQNRLVKRGVLLRAGENNCVHVSGHPCRDELARLYSWIQPRCSVPVHGELRMQVAHAALAKEQGVSHSLVPENGDVIALQGSAPTRVGRVGAGRWAVEGERLIPAASTLYAERRNLASGGLVIATLVLNDKDRLAAPPELFAYGVLDGSHEADSLERLREALTKGANAFANGGGKGGGKAFGGGYGDTGNNGAQANGGKRGKNGKGRKGGKSGGNGKQDPLTELIVRRLRDACVVELGRSPRIEVQVVRV